MKRKFLAITPCLLLVGQVALADFYIAAEYSQSEVDYDETYAFPLNMQSFDGSDKSSGGSLIVGYSFNEYFSLEAGYGDFGSFSYSGELSGVENYPLDDSQIAPNTSTSNAVTGTYKSNLDIKGFKADLVGKLPLNDTFYLKAAIGAFYSDVDSETQVVKNSYFIDHYDVVLPPNDPYMIRSVISGETILEDDNENDLNLTGNLGFGVNFTDHLSAELSWSRYFDVLPSQYDDDFDTYNFRLQYNF